MNLSVNKRHSGVPDPVWMMDREPTHPLIEHGGEWLVWQLMDMIISEVRVAQRWSWGEVNAWWEPRLFPNDTGRGMRPDGLVRLLFYRDQLHVEVFSGNSTWGDKRPRMERIERDYNIPVLFLNRRLLQRLALSDGVDVLHSWMYYVLCRDPANFGRIVSPAELLEYIGEPIPRRTQPKSSVKARRREMVRERLAADVQAA